MNWWNLWHKLVPDEMGEQFLADKSPSIQYQELYAVAVSIILWIHKFRNQRICLFCDNDSVVRMINNSSSGCKNCMVLIRKTVLLSMRWNVRVFAKHVPTDKNVLADALSRFQMFRFWSTIDKWGKLVHKVPCNIPDEIWPVYKMWMD